MEILTPQEINIARLLQQGLTNKEMAKQLGISPATIKNHISNIAQKLNVSRRSQINHCLASYL
ncbi:MAG: helix-turn-helix transcriptional regulator [Bermanella sp.]